MKIALITGATGFIGSHLTKRLAKEGWKVHIIVRQTSKLDMLREIRDKLIIHVHDGSMKGMLEILQESKPDIVFHLASYFTVRHKPDDIDALIGSNILFSTQLVESMVENGIYLMINTGTSWQHYNNEVYNPVNLYAATKQGFESIITYYVKATDLRVINLKLFDTYGRDDPRIKLFYWLKKALREGETLQMSQGEQFLDLVYIDDVIDAFIIASNRIIANRGEKYEEYAVSSGRWIKLKDLVKLFEEIAGARLHAIWGALPYRPREVMCPWDRGENLPGWRPRITLEEGIRRVLEGR